MNIFKRHKLKKKLRVLRSKSEYAMGKMMEHEHDEDCVVWKKWAVLNAMYLEEMLMLRAQLEGIEV